MMTSSINRAVCDIKNRLSYSPYFKIRHYFSEVDMEIWNVRRFLVYENKAALFRVSQDPFEVPKVMIIGIDLASVRPERTLISVSGTST